MTGRARPLRARDYWMPAFAGMTRGGSARRRDDRLLVEVLPLLRLVEHLGRVDELQRALGEGRLDLLARRHEIAAGEQRLRLSDQEIVEQHRGVRMRRIARDAGRRRPRDQGRDDEPVEWRALLLDLLGREAIDSERERNLTGRHEVSEERVPFAYRKPVAGHEIAEQLEALRFAEPQHDLREPVVILRLDRELAPPFRLEQVLIGRGQALLLYLIGVEGLHESIEID